MRRSHARRKATTALAAWIMYAIGSSVTAREADTGSMPKSGSMVVLLGTAGGPLARPARAQPASLLIVDGRYYLIDAGDGVTRQLAQLGVSPAKITTVFITHQHLDHTAGLGSLIAFRWSLAMAGSPLAPMRIYGAPGTSDLAAAALGYFRTSETIFRTENKSGPTMASTVTATDVTPGLVYQDDLVRVTAVENTHYSAVKMMPTPHGLDRSYALRFDTPHGSVVFTGDTGPSQAVTTLAKNADLLVSEVVDVPSIMGMINAQPNILPEASHSLETHMRNEHLTPEAVGRMAMAASVGAVLLTHYATVDDTGAAEARYVAAVRSIYHGPVVAGHDLTAQPVATGR